MPICLALVAILSGTLGVAGGVMGGLPWYMALLLYPLAGSLGCAMVAVAVWLCPRRHAARPNHSAKAA